jgi:subtilisin family serine protease
MRTHYIAALSLLFPFVSAVGCNDVETFNVPSTAAAGSSGTAGSAGTGGSVSAGGTAGTAGQSGTAGTAGSAGDGGQMGGQAGSMTVPPEPSRGDPETFPTECVTTCEEACTALETCKAEDSQLYPISTKKCLERCAMSEGGPVWGDISSTFKCCASQTECSAKQHCGGWLIHPAPIAACDKFCACFVGSSLSAMFWPDAPTPQDYQKSETQVILDTAGQSLDMRDFPGATMEVRGRYTLVRFTQDLPEHLWRSLAKQVKILPTFVNSQGQVAGATGMIHVRIGAPQARAAAEQVVKQRGKRKLVANQLNASLYRIDVEAGQESLQLLAALNQVPGVRAEADMVRLHELYYQPNDPRFPDQWHLENTGQDGSIVGVDGRVSEAWDLVKGNANSIIAINDTGVDVTHPDLIDNTLTPLNFPMDFQSMLDMGTFGGHGTNCAGVAAARGDNEEGVSGVCPECKILPAWVGPDNPDGPGLLIDDNDLATNFKSMADMGAAVISNSWGYGSNDPMFKESAPGFVGLPLVIAESFDYAETQGRGGKGTVIVFASGNSNISTFKNPYPTHPTVVTVAAVDNLGLKSYYSNFGGEVDIAAPSNGGTLGISTTRVTPSGEMAKYTRNFGGTSSATPFVAGVIGLIVAANPELTAQEVRDILANSATKIDPVYGDWDNTGFSPHYGHGLVNAYKAVKMALGECSAGESCEAPSDTCANGDCPKQPCSPCRTNQECAADHVCQALPNLGMATCVPKAVAGACATGYELAGDYCVPTRQTCGLCGGVETCDGQDNDCNGVVDDAPECEGRRCYVNDQGCAADEQCAATFCVPACKKNADCPTNYECKAVKNRYGVSDNLGGCRLRQQSACNAGCQVLASTLPDDTLKSFVDCMKDGAASCSVAQTCTTYLPVTF